MTDHLQAIARDAEVVTGGELSALLDAGGGNAYIGFEPSGIVHVGWLVCMRKMREVADAGFDLTVYLADWHAFVNDKLRGDIGTIRLCGEYLEEVFRVADIPCRFRYASDLMDSMDYWETVMRVMKVSTLARTRRAMTIMGRGEDEGDSDMSKFLYPALQVSDIFRMDVDLAIGGMDQRHAHMLQRDVAEKLGWKKAVAVHTPLIAGLRSGGRMDPVVKQWTDPRGIVRTEGPVTTDERTKASKTTLDPIRAKMSKSDPEATIAVHDGPDEVRRKLEKAYCPPTPDGNPVFEIAGHIVIPYNGKFTLLRDLKHGGDVEYATAADLARAFTAGEVHPADLKASVAGALNAILEPFRAHFASRREVIDRITSSVSR